MVGFVDKRKALLVWGSLPLVIVVQRDGVDEIERFVSSSGEVPRLERVMIKPLRNGYNTAPSPDLYHRMSSCRFHCKVHHGFLPNPSVKIFR